jgi:hypothetical protein
MGDIEDIGGWPKIIEEDPSRPHEIWEKPDETDEPYDIAYLRESYYRNTGNVYFALTAFKEFHNLGLYPPKWVLDALAERFAKHLANPDPDLFSSQLGVSGRGSGATKPHDEFLWWQERISALEDMMILVGGFDITFTDAARAIIEKHDLPITEKTLMNSFRDIYGDPKPFLKKNRDGKHQDPFFLEPVEGRKAYLSEFPRRTLRFINKKKPAKR